MYFQVSTDAILDGSYNENKIIILTKEKLIKAVAETKPSVSQEEIEKFIQFKNKCR